MKYGVLFDSFWDGPTGTAIAEAGGAAAQLVALYLVGNPDDNMIGLYGLNLAIMRERIATLNRRAIEQAVIVLGEVGFADYDTATDYVWVREMARYRLNLYDKPLNPADKRAIGAQRLYERAKPNPFLIPFFKKYRDDLHLSKARRYEGAHVPLARGSEAPSKPVTESETGTETEIRKSDQEDQDQRADARAESHNVLVKLAHTVLDEVDRGIRPISDAGAALKDLAAAARVFYDASAIQKAMDSAEYQRKRRRSA